MSELAPLRVSCVFEFPDFMVLHSVAASAPRVSRHNRKWRNIIWLGGLTVAVFLIVSVCLVLQTTAHAMLSCLLGVVVFLNSAFVIDQLSRKAQLQSYFSLTRLANQAITYELSEAGITYESKASRGIYEWVDIIRYATAPEHLLLFVGDLEAIVLPRRAFASDAEFAAAITFAKERIHGQTL